MLEDIRFAVVDFFNAKLDKRFGFARAEDNGETIFVHLDSFADLAFGNEFGNESVIFDKTEVPIDSPEFLKRGDKICFVGYTPANRDHKTTASAWNLKVMYEAMDLSLKIRNRQRQIILRYGGLENVAGQCKRCGLEKPLMVAELRSGSMPADANLFRLARHNLKGTNVVCFASGKPAQNIVCKITNF